MSVELQGDALQEDRPQTSKRSRAASRQERTQSYMRSTSINFSRDPPDNSPAVKRKNTLDKRRNQPSPEPQIRPSSQQQSFRTGMTLQEFIANGPEAYNTDPYDFGHKEQQLVVDWRSNFRIEELNEDQQDESRRQAVESKPRLQQQPVVQQRPPRRPTLPVQYNPVVRNTKRNTTMNFYTHKRVSSNVEKFEAGEQYLLKKYAEKFKLNEDGGRRRVDSVIHKVSNESLAKLKHNFGRFT